VPDLIPTRVVPHAQVGTLPVADIDPWAERPYPRTTLDVLREQPPAHAETDTTRRPTSTARVVLVALWTQMLTSSTALVVTAIGHSLWPLFWLVTVSTLALLVAAFAVHVTEG
jgi:hypothetical protein